MSILLPCLSVHHVCAWSKGVEFPETGVIASCQLNYWTILPASKGFLFLFFKDCVCVCPTVWLCVCKPVCTYAGHKTTLGLLLLVSSCSCEASPFPLPQPRLTFSQLAWMPPGQQSLYTCPCSAEVGAELGADSTDAWLVAWCWDLNSSPYNHSGSALIQGHFPALEVYWFYA